MNSTPLVITFPAGEVRSSSATGLAGGVIEVFAGHGSASHALLATTSAAFLQAPKVAMSRFLDALDAIFPADRREQLSCGIGFHFKDGTRLDAWPDALFFRTEERNEESLLTADDWADEDTVEETLGAIVCRIAQSESSNLKALKEDRARY